MSKKSKDTDIEKKKEELPKASAEAVLTDTADNKTELLNGGKSKVLFTRRKLESVHQTIMTLTHGKLEPVGSWRRGKKSNIGDLDYITTLPLNQVAKMLDIPDAPNISKFRKELIFSFNKVPINVWNCTESQWPFFLLAYTGDATFEKAIRKAAKKKGYKLNQYGIYDRQTNKPVDVKFKKEEDIFAFLEWNWHSPEERSFDDKKNN